MRHWCCCER